MHKGKRKRREKKGGEEKTSFCHSFISQSLLLNRFVHYGIAERGKKKKKGKGDTFLLFFDNPPPPCRKEGKKKKKKKDVGLFIFYRELTQRLLADPVW